MKERIRNDILDMMVFKENKDSFGYKLAGQIFEAAVEVVGKRAVKLSQIVIEHPALAQFGDYSTNVAMRIKRPPELATPFDLANAIVNAWRSAGLSDYVAKIEVVNPGFINIWLQNETLISYMLSVLKEKIRFGSSLMGKSKTVVIDYSSPNIAKPFGVGHLRSTIIGQAIYNLYRFLGHKTIGDNHLGDWGTQFGKMIVALKHWNKKPVKNLTVADLVKLYVKFHQEAEKKPELEEEARSWFKKLEDGDKEARIIWQQCVDISLKDFSRIYELLGVKIDYAYGEAFYEDKMDDIVASAKRKKIAKNSQGALIIDFPEFGIPPAMLLKSDGATTYETRDLACIAYRKKRWQPDLYIYEVGSEQKLHFQQTFAAAELLGLGKNVHFVHVAHGLIRLPTGKMSTRAGKIVYLEEVLSEAIKRAAKIIKSSETSRGLSKKAQAEVAKAVGVGAVKYFDLMHHYSSDIIFDWEKMFQMEGNSGPYLQYTYARTQSVLRKSKIPNSKFQINPKFQIPNSKLNLNSEELALLRTIYKFPEVVVEAGQNFAPNLICNYLYDLAQKYNFFYNKWPILKAQPKALAEFRLSLTAAVGQILQNGLGLLGIKTPEKM